MKPPDGDTVQHPLYPWIYLWGTLVGSAVPWSNHFYIVYVEIYECAKLLFLTPYYIACMNEVDNVGLSTIY